MSEPTCALRSAIVDGEPKTGLATSADISNKVCAGGLVGSSGANCKDIRDVYGVEGLVSAKPVPAIGAVADDMPISKSAHDAAALVRICGTSDTAPDPNSCDNVAEHE